VALLEEAHDLHRVRHDLVPVFDDRDEALPRGALDQRAVGVVDPDGLRLEPLVRERKCDALGVRREAGAVELDHAGW
jgi:hypothetical protein